MKKILLAFAILAITALAFSSCQKYYCCNPTHPNTQGKLTVSLSSSNPPAHVIEVSTTVGTNNIELLIPKIKVTDIDLTLRKQSIKLLISPGAVFADAINTIKLKANGKIIDALDGSAINSTGIVTFSNLSTSFSQFPAGTTTEFSVVVDVKKIGTPGFPEGTTLQAQLSSTEVQAISTIYQNGDNFTGTRVGSAIGETMTFYSCETTVVMSTAISTITVGKGRNVTSIFWSIPLAVTASCRDLYIGNTSQLAAVATAKNAIAFVFQNKANSYTDERSSTASSSFISDDASSNPSGKGFVIPAGATKHFHVKIILTDPETVNTYYRVQLKQIRTFTDENLTIGANNINLLPAENFRTPSVFIIN